MPTVVRRKSAQDVYQVVPLTENKSFSTLFGVTRHGRVGDLQIIDTLGVLVDVVPPDLLLQTYEPIDAGAITLSSAHVARIAKVVRFGSARSADEIVLGVEEIAKVTIGNIRMEWTPGQLSELEHRATKRGWTVEKYLEYVLGRFTQELWNY